MSCDSAGDCDHHGTCNDGECDCDFGWFGNHCTDPGESMWGYEWEMFKIVFSAMFYTIFVWALLKLLKGMMIEKVHGFRHFVKRIFNSPKNLSILLVCLICFMRGVWLSIDPYGFKEIIDSYLLDRLIFEMAYPMLFNLYSCILLVWSGLYQGIAPAERKLTPFNYIRKVIVLIIILTYVLCPVFIICKGLREGGSEWFQASLIGVGVLVLF